MKSSKYLILMKENEPLLLRNARRASFLILGLLGLLTVAGAWFVPRLNTHYSMKQFLPNAHPLIQTDDKAKARFQLSDLEPVLFVLEGSESWLDENRIHRLRSVTERIAALDPAVEKTVSLATVEGASLGREGITVGRLLELTPPSEWRRRVLEDPTLTPQIISRDGTSTVMAVTLRDVPTAKMAELQGRMRALLQESLPGTRVSLGGVPAIQVEMNRVLGLELRNFLGLSLAASIGMLLLFFRTISSVLIPLVLVTMANVLCLAWMAATGVPFTVLTTTLPVLVAITVVSMSTHTMLRYAADWDLAGRTRENPNRLRVLARSYRGLLLPNTLTAITTAVGFLAISITDVPLIRQYGWTVGVSIFVCWAVVIVALPPFLAIAPVPRARKFTEAKSRWALLPVTFKGRTIAVILALCAVLAWIGKDLNWAPRLFDDLPRNQEARLVTERIDSRLGGMIPLGLVVEFPEENAWNDPEALRKLHSLAARWREDARVGSAVGYSDFLESAGRVQGRSLPNSRQQAAEDVFLYTFADSNPLRHFLTADGRAARIQLRAHDLPATELRALVEEAHASAAAAFPSARIVTSGMATTVHELNNELSRELIWGFWQALACIALVLLLTFRSLRWTIAAVVPNLVPPVVLLGFLSLLDTPIKPGIAVIFSIALGISFDNTIYLLGRLRLISRTKQGLPVAKAWYQEANLCLWSSLAIAAGFVIFMASYFSLNQQFGFYMVVSIAGGLLGDLVLLPALLEAFPSLLQPSPSRKELSMTPLKKAAVAILSLLAAHQSWAASVDPNNAKSLLDAVEKNLHSNDEVATLKMKIVEPDGTAKERALEIRRKGADERQKVLVRMQQPADLRGTALLSVSKGKESDQWLYLPSSKQTRRILSNKRSSSFMDSELSYEDMGTSSDARYESKVLRQEARGGQNYSVVESVPKGESSYGKVQIWVNLSTHLVDRMEYFDKSQKLLKITEFSNYKKNDKGIWRAGTVNVKNVQTQRGTVLTLSGLRVNQGLSDSEFTESALTDGE